MKKLLMISYSYPPSNAPAAQRAYFFAKYLTEWNKVVITAEKYDSSLGSSNWAEQLDDTMILRTKNIDMSFYRKAKDEKAFGQSAEGERKSNSSKRSIKSRIVLFLRSLIISDKAFAWRPSAYGQAIELINRDSSIKCIFSSSPLFSNHLITAKLKRKAGMYWIADFRDFHYLNVIENNGRFIRRFINKLWEQRIMKESDRIVFISESMKQEYVKRYPAIADKARVIHNGFDPEEYSPREEPLPKRPITIFYAGSFYGGDRDPLPLFMALDNLIEQGVITENDIEVRIAGNIDNQLLDRINRFRSSSSLKLYGKIDRKKVLQLMQESHFLWLIMGKTVAHTAGYPVKFFEYLASRRPILAFAPEGTEMVNTIRNLGIGEIFSLDNSRESIENNARLLHRILDELDDKWLLPLNIEENKIKLFSRKYQAEQLREVLDEISDSDEKDKVIK